jgi:hypothetical protein
MTTGSNPIEAGTDLIDTREIADRIEYLQFLDNDDIDPEFWEDEIEELAKLRQVMTDVFGSGADDDSVTLISDSYWKRYADEYADEVFSLDDTGAAQYFEYSRFADDYQSDFSELVFDGVTYWYQMS